MTATAFQNLKPGDTVEILRGKFRGVRAVVRSLDKDGIHARIDLPGGVGIFARATTIRLPKQG